MSDQRIATFAAQRSRNWLPHAFGLSARLRAFSSGYRVVPIPDRNGHAPKSSKSAAPAKAVARRVGAQLPKGHLHDFAARYTGSPLPCRATTSCGRLRRLPHHFTPSGKSSQRDHRPLQAGTTAKLRTPVVLTTRAPLFTRQQTPPPPSFVGIPHKDCCPPATNQKVSLTAQRWHPAPGLPPFAPPRTGSPIGPWDLGERHSRPFRHSSKELNSFVPRLVCCFPTGVILSFPTKKSQARSNFSAGRSFRVRDRSLK